MSEPVVQDQQAARAELNGQGAAPGQQQAEPAAGPVPGADRALGLITVGLGLFLILAGIDRYTGGVVSAALSGLVSGAGDDATSG